MRGNGRKPGGRSVTSKVTAILDAFSPVHPELSLGELARLADIPVSTTYRLASELVGWGGLERAGGSGYRVGLRLWEVGSLSPRSATLHEVVLPFMQDLFQVTHENVHLAVREGHEALYVERVTGRRSVTVRSRRGARLPLHATGVGKVLLAHAPDWVQEEVLSGPLKRFTAYTIVAPGLLRRTLREIVRTGVGYAREEMTVGRTAVAVPVLDSTGHAAAAMSIVLPATRSDLDRLEPALRTAARCASRELGQRHAILRASDLAVAEPAGAPRRRPVRPDPLRSSR